MPLLSSERFWELTRSCPPLVSDGGFGSELIELGVPPNETMRANLSRPEMVRDIHEAYIAAGAHFISTNTFGLDCAADWLSAFRAGVEIAIQTVLSCDREVGVWLCIPGRVFPKTYETSPDLPVRAGSRPTSLLVETCTTVVEAQSAARFAMRLSPQILAITAHFGDGCIMADGTTPEEFAVVAESLGAQVIGANCGQAPEQFVSIARRMRRVTSSPLLIQPSAGTPKRAGEFRWQYPVDPGRFAHVGARVAEAGATIIGGCCGASPAHISDLSKRLRT